MHYYQPSNDFNVFLNKLEGKSKSVSLVYGLPLSGKTFITNELGNFGYSVLKLDLFIEEIKKIRNVDDPDSVVVDLAILIEELQNVINKLRPGEELLLDNFENPAGLGLLTEVGHFEELFSKIGKLSKVFSLQTEEVVLRDRYKVKNEIEELNEDKEAEFKETLLLPAKLLTCFTENSFEKVEINTNYAEDKTRVTLKNLLEIKLIVINNGQFDLLKDISFIDFSLRLFTVHVPYLIEQQFVNKTNWMRRLEDTYSPRKLKIDDRYNPLHYDEKLVLELIKKTIKENKWQIENNGNYVIIMGWMNNQLLSKEETSFNLPLNDVLKVINLGQLVGFFNIDLDHQESIERETVELYEEEDEEQVVVNDHASYESGRQASFHEPAKDELLDENGNRLSLTSNNSL